MRIITIIFINLILTTFLTGQTRLIKGMVMDSQTKQGVENVHIFLDNNEAGTYSDENGYFILSTQNSKNIVLTFSAIGYDTRQLEIDPKRNDFLIELTPSITELPDIYVSSKRQIDTISNVNYSVVDYQFYGDYIILLIHRNSFKKYSLVLLNKEEIVLDEVNLKDYRPINLHSNCLDDLFLHTTINYYPISIVSDQLIIGKHLEEKHYSEFIEPCLVSTENFTYFSQAFFQNQAIKIFGVDKQNKEKRQFELIFIQNERNIDLLIEELGIRMPWSGDVWEENVSERLSNLRTAPYNLAGIMKIFYPPIYAPLIKMDTQLCLFNHCESKLEHYSFSGKPLKTLNIDYHLNKKWKKQLYFDIISQRAYTFFKSRWGTIIREIDLDTGNLTEIGIPIDKSFLQKVKIRNGYCYFLSQDVVLSKWNKVLHKIRID